MDHMRSLEINPIARGSSRNMIQPGLHFILLIASVWRMNLNVMR